ncbi:BAG family molecular chaperone regulator 2 [Anthonomus grandis grandis]|uniref:BAG family molecular chaperone regulator 2 n=1 Tax=Anthonomus grandis grandis TaxID=2921223 RepID=UPI002165A8A5|nr:BAG family molecular chaperone regulator 2 [Anthonomus grandis grandis]
MDVDHSIATSSELTTSILLPKIDENIMDKHPKERIVEILDVLEGHVERIRREAAQLEENRDHVLATLDSILQNDLINQLDESDADDVTRYAERVMNRCQTVEVRVLTLRDQMQEDALSQINHLIDSLVMDLRHDHEAAKQRCLSYMNACSSIMVEGVMDKKFESALLGCTLDDQKRVKKRLQGLLSYFERLRVQMFE